MALAFAAFLCGLLFGAGLIVSQMIWPPKVLNFLDLAGSWDPSLLVVMATALAVSSGGYALARARGPVLADQCQWPNKTRVDAPLVIGAMMFGTAWGLVGLCPGPALVNLASLSPQIIGFVLAMSAGMILHDLWRDYWPMRRGREAVADG